MRWEPREPPEGINVSRTHPLAELATLATGIAIATAVFVALGAFLVEGVVARLPAGVEVRVFGSLWDAHDALSDAPAHPRAAAAQALLARLADHWPENPYPLRLRVVESDDANAFAAPGGLVAVTRGLLDEVASENELAFVLGHELGHFRGRHHLRGLGRGVVVHLVLAVVLGTSGAEALPTLVSSLAESRFAREQEREADRFGLALVYREYGHVAGADGFFRRLLADQGSGADARVVSWVSTHPLSADRVDALARERRAHGWPARGVQTPL